MTKLKRNTHLQLHPKIKETLEPLNKDWWIQKQIKQYQPNLQMPPIPNYKKINYQPTLEIKTINLLQEIPGNSLSQKITNLYFNDLTRKHKKKQREKILKKLFPHNRHI